MKINNYLSFGKPYLSFEGDYVFLNCDVEFEGVTKRYWFKYDKKYKDCLVTESNEAFVLSFFPYCSKKDISIKSEYPINETFKYQVEEYLLPTLIRNIPSYHKISIDCPITNIKYGGNGVGVGISCGVDSSYTILKNYNTHSKESNLNINYVCFFNAGSSGSDENDRKLFEGRLLLAKQAADYLDLELICVETNINTIYKDFDYESVHSYRTLSIPLTLQKLFGRYYYSSSFVFEDFKIDDSDPAYHDLLTMSCISTPSLVFTVVGSEITRLEKVRFISNYDFSKKHLNVCIRKQHNCSKCYKCIRTMFELFLIGRLDEFKEVFDTDYFYKNFDSLVVFVINNKKGIDMPEIYESLCKMGYIKCKHRRKSFINKIKRFILKTFKAGKKK